MNLRIFVALQVLMLSVVLIVTPLLSGANEILATLILDFAVFYLSAMFVGYLVVSAPIANALAVNITFNLIYYIVLFLTGWGYTLTFEALAVDTAATLAFTILGCIVGQRSRSAASDQDVAG